MFRRTRGARWAAALLLALAAVAGCTRPRPAPEPPPAPGVSAPAPGSSAPAAPRQGKAADLLARVRVEEPDEPQRPALELTPGAAARVGTREVHLVLYLKGPLDQDARWELERHLVWPAGARLQWVNDEVVRVVLGPGPAGPVEVVVRSGAPLPGGGTLAEDVRLTLERVQGVAATFLLRGRPLPADRGPFGLHHVAGEVPLELRFAGPPDWDSLKRALVPSLEAANVRIIRLEQTGETVLALTLSAPPGAQVDLDLQAARDAAGFPILAAPVRLRWGNPVQVWAMDPDGADPQVIASIPHPVEGAVVSPDGHYLAYTEDPGAPGAGGPGRLALWVMDRRRPDPRLVQSGILAGTMPQWAGAGTLVAQDRQGVYRWSFAAPDAVERLDARAPGLALSQDGARVAMLLPVAGPGSAAVKLLPLDGGAPRTRLTGPGVPPEPLLGPVLPMAWRGDGRWLALDVSGPGSAAVRLLEVDGTLGRDIALPSAPGFLAWPPAPEEGYLLAGPYLVDVPGGRVLATLANATNGFWSPDGERILYSVPGPRVRVYTLGTRRDQDLGAGRPAGWLPGGHVLVLRD